MQCKSDIVIRPKGILNILSWFIIIFFLAMICACVGIIVNADKLPRMPYFVMAFGMMVFFIAIVLKIKNIIEYKVVLSNDSIHTESDKIWLVLVCYKAKTLPYKGLQILQYYQDTVIGNLSKPFVLIKAIRFAYGNGKEEIIYLNRFNKKQIKRIMQIIKDICKEYYDTEIEIKPDLLPRKKVKR